MMLDENLARLRTDRTTSTTCAVLDRDRRSCKHHTADREMFAQVGLEALGNSTG